MSTETKVARETAEDIFFGQTVISWARWFLIAGGIILVLWGAEGIGQLTVGTLAVVALMAINFYLHGRQLAQQPANPKLVTLASLMDLGIITGVILAWPDAAHRGLGSPFFIFYYPAVLAFAFVMRPGLTWTYTLAALASYVTVCIVVSPSMVNDSTMLESLVTRSIIILAVGALGTYYWRIQRDRRRVATTSAEKEA